VFWKKEKNTERACRENPQHSGSTTVAEACSDEACSVPAAEADASHCPVSGTKGQRVDLITVKALLNASALRRLDGRSYRFCPAPECPVVYFDTAAGSIFRKEDLTVRVGQKEKGDSSLICYCFGFTLGNIRRDLATRGKTDIPALVRAEVKAGHCACEVKNPQGNCCLGNIAKATKAIEAEILAVSN